MVATRRQNSRRSDDREGVDFVATASGESPSSSSDDDESDTPNEDATFDKDSQIAVAGEPLTTNVVMVHSDTGEQCTFDLHNLLAMNAHQIDTSRLYANNNKKEAATTRTKLTIPGEELGVKINEEYLREKASDGCAQLVAALWQLPVERSDAGPMVSLPLLDASKIPRALPPPPPKKETKWEKFAKERGIATNKEKRSRKVWDEATGSWMFRHGYQKANDSSKEWPIMEVKDHQDPYADPWEQLREEKQKRTTKSRESRMRNEERAGNLPRGTTTRVLKSRDKTRQAGKTGGNLDKVLPAGVPVDLGSTKGDDSVQNTRLRGKASTINALRSAQLSTASLGRFDKVVEGEPERKQAAKSKKRKFESATDKRVIANGAEKSLRLFKAVVEGGGAEKEKARKKGRLAKGETAYDYDFDDGLGPSSFRKKKGRAGAGKMKKMTKKRVK